MIEVKKGSISHTEYFEITDFSCRPAVGKAANHVTASFVRARGISQPIKVFDLAKSDSGFSAGGWKEIDKVRQPGLYRLDVPNNAFYAGTPDRLVVSLKVEGCRIAHKEYILI